MNLSEATKIAFSRKLTALKNGDDAEVAFPSTLSVDERKYLHKLAQQFGFKSRSFGKGDNRFITIVKIVQKSITTFDIATWQLCPKSADILASAVFPEFSSPSVNATKPAVRSSRKANFAKYGDLQSKKAEKSGFSQMMKYRQSLPAWSYADEICTLVLRNQIILISGDTGCGKSTQVPQYLFDHHAIGPHCKIAITQPRRLSAIAIAERIADERCEAIGDAVGYQIRLDTAQSQHTQILFMTPGILLRRIQHDPLLEEFTHIVVDEAHERDRFTDFLLIILRDICSRCPSLKVILMSATLHTEKLCEYFGGIANIHIGTSLFPVQEFFLEDVLEFTDYYGQQSAAQQGHGVAAPIVPARPEFFCCICGDGPYHAPDELGVHAATCFPGQTKQAPPMRIEKDLSLAERLRSLRPTRGLRREVVAATAVVSAKAVGKVGVDEEEEEEEEEVAVGVAHAVQQESSCSALGEIHPLLQRYEAENGDEHIVNYQLILELLRYVYFGSVYGKHGHALVFLPGWEDISSLAALLRGSREFCNQRKFHILQLHSSIAKREQQLIFQRVGAGEHKIILSTNIAEASLTIEDVTVVINSGRMKEKTYDPHTKLAFLQSRWISLASEKQRKGRSGRTCNGVCFHLYSSLRHKHLSSHQDSELLRMPLEDLALQTKVMGVAPGTASDTDPINNITSFLLKAMDPPPLLSIQHGIQLLQSIQCLDSDENLTAVGRALGQLPMNPRMGRMILFGALFGCAAPAVNLAAIMGYRDPFVLAVNEQERAELRGLKMRYCNGMLSDQLTVYQALLEAERAGHHKGGRRNHYVDPAESGPDPAVVRFCDQHYLSYASVAFIQSLTHQLQASLKDIHLDCHDSALNSNSNSAPLLATVASIGLYPDIALRKRGAKLFTTEKQCKAKVHPSSINGKIPRFRDENRALALEILGYQDLVELNTLTSSSIRSASMQMLSTSPMSVLLLLLLASSLKYLQFEVSSGYPAADALLTSLSTLEDIRAHSIPDGEFCALVEVDGHVALRIRGDQLRIVEQARDFLNSVLVEFVRHPVEVLARKDVKDALVRLTEALVIEHLHCIRDK